MLRTTSEIELLLPHSGKNKIGHRFFLLVFPYRSFRNNTKTTVIGNSKSFSFFRCGDGVAFCISQDWMNTWRALESHLSRRAFWPNIDIVLVSTPYAVDGLGSALLERLGGFYFRLAASFNARPCYQRVLPRQSSTAKFSCDGVYLFWSTARACWKLGRLNDHCASFAICVDNQATPHTLSNKWFLQKYPNM